MVRFSNRSLLTFTASRYVCYGLLLVRGILVAGFLGPHLFGILSFLTLVQTYLSYTSLGIQYAINVELATESVSSPEERRKAIGVALSVTMMIAGLLILTSVGLQFWKSPLFLKYSLNRYAVILGISVGFNHIQQVLANVYRVYGKLLRIAISELLTAVLPLLTVCFFRGEHLIAALLGSMVLSSALSVLVFWIGAPFRFACSFDFSYAKKLAHIGVPLLIYTISFYLITVSGRTITGIFYSTEMMGYYSFSTNIASAIMLGLSAVAWVIFPDVLSKTRVGEADEKVRMTVRRVNELYGTSAFVIVFGGLLIAPIMFRLLPQYGPARGVLDVLMISSTMLCMAFGYNCVAIARKKQLTVAYVALISVAITSLLGLVVAVIRMNYIWIAVAVAVGVCAYTILQAYVGLRLIGVERREANWFRTILPWSSVIAGLAYLVGTATGFRELGWIIGVSIFVRGNLDPLRRLYSFVRQSLKEETVAAEMSGR